MNLKKFLFSSLGVAAFAVGTQAQAELLNVTIDPSDPFFLSSALSAGYDYNGNNQTGVFTASVDNLDVIEYFGPISDTFFGTFTFSANINAASAANPVLTGGSFSIIKDAIIENNIEISPTETLLTGSLRAGALDPNTTWGAADTGAPSADLGIFEFTFTPTGGAFWDDFKTLNTAGLGLVKFSLLDAGFTGNWQTDFADTSAPNAVVNVYGTDISFVPEPSSALVGLLLTVGVLSNRRRHNLPPRAANLSSPA